MTRLPLNVAFDTVCDFITDLSDSSVCVCVFEIQTSARGALQFDCFSLFGIVFIHIDRSL